ncbi:MAG: cupin domain-containing protein [Rikenellaceae bacterium]|jgi:quercetin dioxygenase-like cupin family protein|nr:cupin domain-containing protein [Rikenellaceae bacterium]
MKKIILILLLAGWSAAWAQAPKTDGTKADIASCVSVMTDDNVEPTGAGWQYWFIPKGGADTLTVKMSRVWKVPYSHTPHRHNEDEAFYVARGPLVFHLNGEERTLQTGDFFYAPSGSSHNIRRPGDEPIQYLVIKRETTSPLPKPYAFKANYTIDDCINPFDAGKLVANGAAKAFWYLTKENTESLNVKLSIVAPDVPRTHAAHSHPEQEVFFILEGQAEVEMNGKTKVLGPNSSFYCPPGSQHGIRRVSDGTLKYLVIKTE